VPRRRRQCLRWPCCVTVRPTTSHRGMPPVEEPWGSVPHPTPTSMGVPVAPSRASGPAVTPLNWSLGLSTPLRPLPILGVPQDREGAG
jgi:hypothetical protein